MRYILNNDTRVKQCIAFIQCNDGEKRQLHSFITFTALGHIIHDSYLESELIIHPVTKAHQFKVTI